MATETETQLDVNHSGMSYTITNMDGRTIQYLKDYMVESGIVFSGKERAEVFSMNPEGKDAAGVVNSGPGMMTRTNEATPVVQIMQGYMLEVNFNYVLNKHDLAVNFQDPE